MEAVYSSGSFRTTLNDFIPQEITIGATTAMSIFLYGVSRFGRIPKSIQKFKFELMNSKRQPQTYLPSQTAHKQACHRTLSYRSHFQLYEQLQWKLLCGVVEPQHCRGHTSADFPQLVWSSGSGGGTGHLQDQVRLTSIWNIGVYHIDAMELHSVDTFKRAYCLGLQIVVPKTFALQTFKASLYTFSGVCRQIPLNLLVPGNVLLISHFFVLSEHKEMRARLRKVHQPRIASTFFHATSDPRPNEFHTQQVVNVRSVISWAKSVHLQHSR